MPSLTIRVSANANPKRTDNKHWNDNYKRQKTNRWWWKVNWTHGAHVHIITFVNSSGARWCQDCDTHLPREQDICLLDNGDGGLYHGWINECPTCPYVYVLCMCFNFKQNQLLLLSLLCICVIYVSYINAWVPSCPEVYVCVCACLYMYFYDVLGWLHAFGQRNKADRPSNSQTKMLKYTNAKIHKC